MRSGIKQIMKDFGDGSFAGSMLLGDIVGFETRTLRLQCSVITVTGLGGTNLEFYFASNVIQQKFLNMLQTSIQKAKVVSSRDDVSTEKRLEQLSQLYKNGLINEDEYQNKRKDILNQL
jgi:uncharacterized membrane protein